MTPLAEILNEFGIDVLDTRHQHKRGPGQTCAAGTLEEILRDEGSAHLRSVLMTVMESENNRMALVRPVLLAVSDVLRGHPDWMGAKWFDAFDAIDLCDLHRVARAHKEVMKTRNLVGGMILERLRSHFGDDEQGRLL